MERPQPGRRAYRNSVQNFAIFLLRLERAPPPTFTSPFVGRSKYLSVAKVFRVGDRFRHRPHPTNSLRSFVDLPTEGEVKSTMLRRQITAEINFPARFSRASPCRDRRISFCAHDIFQRRAGRRSVSLHLWGFGRNVRSTVTVQGGARRLFSNWPPMDS